MPECVRVYCERGSVSVPRRKPDTHKGDYGRLLIVGGSVGYTGAPNLCARAAVRSGAGLVFLGVPEAIWSVCAVKCDEAMPFPLPCDEAGRLAEAAAGPILERLSSCDVLALGVGLGRSEDIRRLCRAVLRGCDKPLVLDADALWAISDRPELLRETKSEVVVTPHEGEFLRLGGDLSQGRERGAWDLSQRYGCITVLKGHRTIVAHPAGRLYSIEAGNPGMAKGGSGDVLTGVTGALLGQTDAEKAAVTACAVHAFAGDACAARLGEYGMTPSDIIEELPHIFKKITE